MLIQYILLIIVFFILVQTIRKFKAKKISLREAIFWILVWVVAGVVVILPQITTFLAERLGVGRGADLVLYAGLVMVFYLIFRLFIRQQKIEQDISKIVEQSAIKDKK